jgi:two-component system, OmpR family, response regulator
VDAGLNILVVEDHDDLREAMTEGLQAHGFHVFPFGCVEEIAEQSALLHIDLAILDLNLPGEDGLDFAERLRRTHPDIGIILFTARTLSPQRQAGFERGADIYLTKPASLSELVAAVQALERRLRRSVESVKLVLDSVQLELRGSQGERVSLNVSEAQLLAALARAQQHRLENWQIAEVLGRRDEDFSKAALELHIVRLRKKLLQVGADPAIRAIRGWGYQLCVSITVA